MMNFIKNTIQKGVVVLTLLMMLTSLAEANQVGFVESRVSVIAGQSITLHLIGSGFSSGPESVSFSMAWDDSLLKYSGNEVANPPWDSLTVTPPNGGSGLLDVVLLANASGNLGSVGLRDCFIHLYGAGCAAYQQLIDKFSGY